MSTGIVTALKAGDTPEWRLDLAKKIEKKEIDVKYPSCDIRKLKDVIVIPPNSASTTAVFLAKHEYPGADRKVVFKSSFDLHPKAYLTDNSLPIEFINYRMIANSMVANRWTPHVATTIATFQCDMKELEAHPRLYDRIFGDEYKNFQTELLRKKRKGQKAGETCGKGLKNKVYTDKYLKDASGAHLHLPRSLWCAATRENRDAIKASGEPQYDLVTPKMNFILTEALGGKKFEEWYMEDHSIDEWKSVLFQVLYTLECFNRINFRHNDLHLGNIFVEATPLKYILYIIDTDSATMSYVKVPTNGWTARIYDFDRSTLACTPSSYNKKYEEFINEYATLVQKTHATTGLPIMGPARCENTHVTNADCDWGACQGVNHTFDVFTFLGLIWASRKNIQEELQHKFDAEDPDEEDHNGLGGLFGKEYAKDPVTKEEFATGRWAKIPNEVIDFIENHIHRDAYKGSEFKGIADFDPLTTNWNFGMRSSKIAKGIVVPGSSEGPSNNNMEIPEKSMDRIEMMLEDRSFFNFEIGDASTLAKDCQNADIFHLPMRPGVAGQQDYSALTCAVEVSKTPSKPRRNRMAELPDEEDLPRIVIAAATGDSAKLTVIPPPPAAAAPRKALRVREETHIRPRNAPKKQDKPLKTPRMVKELGSASIEGWRRKNRPEMFE
jgi:hypothetical protein